MLGISLERSRAYQEIKQEGIQQGREEGIQQGREEGREEGRKESSLNLLIRQLTKRFGELPEEVKNHIASLSLTNLENLGEALLDFTSLQDLQVWLNQQQD